MTHNEYIEVMRLVETAVRASGRHAFIRAKEGKDHPDADRALLLLREALEELEAFDPDIHLYE